VLAENCVFDKQSPEPLHCALSTHPNNQMRLEGPLIANLRGQIAEFLKDGSLERLRIFSSPTCVSFSTVMHRCPV
jgi:hypothetical protein